VTQSEASALNAKELQRVESLAKVIQTLGKLKKDIAENERMLKALIKSLENKYLNPCTLESLYPLLQLNWRRTKKINIPFSGNSRTGLKSVNIK